MAEEKVCSGFRYLVLRENINNWCAVKGTLKGYDALMNLVLDDVEEKLTGTNSAVCVPVGSLSDNPADDEGKEAWRSLGLVVARGTLLVGISPVDGSEEIANPFVQQEDE
jgi:U6 snRNA-associated Sm-like protein LSm7